MNDLTAFLGQSDYDKNTIPDEIIKSINDNDTDILRGIIQLHLNNEPFDCDPTYSKGSMWSNIKSPRLKFDIKPVLKDVEKASSTKLPLPDNSIQSIAFDPPFIFGNHGQQKNNIMVKRFTKFDSWKDLQSMYCDSLKEFHRVLKLKGILAFKCQDLTDTYTTMTHCYVWQWAQEIGFYPKDLFIRYVHGGRIFNPKQTQHHARKFHSYWWVFEKITK